MPKNTTVGFTKADGRNLPVVNDETLNKFLEENLDAEPELRHVKVARSCRSTYFLKAVGFVEVRRDGDICYVKGKVTPEHRVRSPSYSVTCSIHELENKVLEAKCLDCVASEGVCKHVVAFIAWLRWKSEEVAPTSKECYWKKARLSDVGTKVKFVEVATMKRKAPEKSPPIDLDQGEAMYNQPSSSNQNCRSAENSKHPNPEQKEGFFNFLVSKLKENQSNALLLKQVSETTSYSLFHLMIAFKKTELPHNAPKFLKFCRSLMNMKECELIYERTKEQAQCAEWNDMRFGRVTASILWAASRCLTPDGSLANQIAGASSIPDTPAMKRGRELEPDVLANVGRRYNGKVQKRGIKLHPEIPIFGASPDGILKNKVVEVKCPSTYERFKEYFSKDMTEPAPVYKAQVMLQLLMCKKMKGLFCVAEPSFKTTGHVTVVEVALDTIFLKDIMLKALKFWKDNIYPRLYNAIS
ncbi:unnamed protein product [Bemisia tabaci]|uniref:YqaJ viral recombinase domain-containing protein n=1 Tax=Bemisia tabaci TaxID=7038 RepID=A0A9P0F4G6_BEMTA|nr:unnamed protein product [Bemisia tabaci]